jgi:hypothetical protein
MGDLLNRPLRPRNLIIAAAVISAAVLLYALFEKVTPPPVPPADPQYTRAEPDPVVLMDAFLSYDSIATVTQRLQAAGIQWKTDQSHLPHVPGRPPYDFDTLTVDGPQHLGSPGTMVLEFFNDRLYSVTFRPANAKAYIARLRRQNHHMERTHVSVWEAIEGNLRISSNADFAVSDEGRQLDTPLYITWEDTRLTAQIRRWYDTFGRKPLKPN